MTLRFIYDGCLEQENLFRKNTECIARHRGHVNILIYSNKRDKALLHCIKSNYGLTVLSRGHRKRRKSHLCVDQMRCMCYSIASQYKGIANPQYCQKSANEFPHPEKAYCMVCFESVVSNCIILHAPVDRQ